MEKNLSFSLGILFFAIPFLFFSTILISFFLSTANQTSRLGTLLIKKTCFFCILFGFAPFIFEMGDLLSENRMVLLGLLFIYSVVFIGFIYRLIQLHNPFYILKFLGQEAKQAPGKKFEEWNEAIEEIGIQAIDRRQTSIVNAVSDELVELAHQLFKAKNPVEFLNYHLLQILKKLEFLLNRGVTHSLDLVVNHLFRSLCKIASLSFNFQPGSTSLVVHFIYQATQQVIKAPLLNLIDPFMVSLFELIKSLTSTPSLQDKELKTSFIRLITTLEDLAKAQFRNNKSTPMIILTTPFVELGKLFEKEPMKSHADTPYITQQLNRILGEFQALELVMKTIPPIDLDFGDKEDSTKSSDSKVAQGKNETNQL